MSQDIEPGAASGHIHPSLGSEIAFMNADSLRSIAISMKRIADAMHSDANGVGIRDSIWAISDRMPTGS